MHKSLIDSNTLYIRFNEIDAFVIVYDGTRYLVFFKTENMIPLTIGLNILLM